MQKNNFVVYNPDSITFENNLYAKKHNVPVLCSYSALWSQNYSVKNH